MTPSQSLPRHLYLSVPHMGGREATYVSEAFDSNWLSTVGPNLNQLEARFSELIGLPSLALCNGTAGLHLGIKLLQVQPGDEVVTPTLTFAASCNPLLYEQAIPVFMDSERRSWNLDPDLLADFLQRRARVNKLPKAVTVVHLFGQSADLDPILEECRRYELPLLEDAAECLGSFYKGRVPGTDGEVGVYSFNGNKIITATSGGMLVARRKELVNRARHWSTQARDADPLKNYVHSELGYNYRMSNLLAGVALGQLEVLEERVNQRRDVFDRYRKTFAAIPGIEPQPEELYGAVPRGNGTANSSLSESAPLRSRHTRWLSCFLIDEAQFGMSAGDLVQFLAKANVEARPVWKPMHTQPLYRHYECIGGHVAEDLNQRGICLPSSSSLALEDQEFVIERVAEAHRMSTARRGLQCAT